MRVLEGADLTCVLQHADAYRIVFELLAFTGLRINEGLGLRWCDVDYDAGVIRVRLQLSRHRELKQLKTEAAQHDIVMTPSVARLLRQMLARLALQGQRGLHVLRVEWSRRSTTADVGEDFQAAVRQAGLTGRGQSSRSTRCATASPRS